MTIDRLDEIKDEFDLGYPKVSRYAVAWLIAEVERLRAFEDCHINECYGCPCCNQELAEKKPL